MRTFVLFLFVKVCLKSLETGLIDREHEILLRNKGKLTDVLWSPEGDGAAAQTDVVRGGGSGHCAGLGPTFTPPTASKIGQMSLPNYGLCKLV